MRLFFRLAPPAANVAIHRCLGRDTRHFALAIVASLTYQAASSYFTLKEGDYEICFAYAGTSTMVMGSTPFHVANGDGARCPYA